MIDNKVNKREIKRLEKGSCTRVQDLSLIFRQAETLKRLKDEQIRDQEIKKEN